MIAADNGIDGQVGIPDITHEVTTHLWKLAIRYRIQWLSFNDPKEVAELAFGALPGTVLVANSCIQGQLFLSAGDKCGDVATWFEGHLLASTTLQSKTELHVLVAGSNFWTVPG